MCPANEDNSQVIPTEEVLALPESKDQNENVVETPTANAGDKEVCTLYRGHTRGSYILFIQRDFKVKMSLPEKANSLATQQFFSNGTIFW